MIKTREIQTELTIQRYSAQTVVEVCISLRSACEWSGTLSLLREGLISALICRDKRGKKILELRRAVRNQQSGVRATLKDSHVVIALNNDALEYVWYYVLKYYRDGLAAVNHIDVQAYTQKGLDVYLTVRAAESAASMTAEEVKKRLGVT